MPTLDSIVQRFARSSREVRLETLLAYANRLPSLPDRLAASRDAGLGRVHECQTPVFLWLEAPDGKLALHADVPRESPTVRGFVSILATALADQPPTAASAIPDDLIDRLGLSDALGMTRTQGLSAIVRRVKRLAGEL